MTDAFFELSKDCSQRFASTSRQAASRELLPPRSEEPAEHSLKGDARQQTRKLSLKQIYLIYSSARGLLRCYRGVTQFPLLSPWCVRKFFWPCPSPGGQEAARVFECF
jgi:hypothetical protein